jgi:glycosyltransferase involved in cell wall biosynthesis
MLGIVIPAYEREDCLRGALDSLVNQTKKMFIVIVVDDHSPEPLEKIVNEYRNKLHIIYKYADENGGPGAARQIGLNVCYEKEIDLVMFLDSDDKLYPHAVERLTTEINRNRADVVSSKIWAEDNRNLGSYLDEHNRTWLHGKIYRTDFLKKNNIIFPPVRFNEDVAFNIMSMGLAEKKMAISEALYLFRNEKNSLCRNKKTQTKDMNFDFIRAVYFAANFLEKNKNNYDSLLPAITTCYKEYQAVLSLGEEVPCEIKQKLKYLLSLDSVKKELSNHRKMVSFTLKLGHCTVVDNKIVWYPQTFKQWLDEIYESSNN